MMDDQIDLQSDGVYNIFSSSIWHLIADEHRAAYSALDNLLKDTSAIAAHAQTIDTEMRARIQDSELHVIFEQLAEEKSIEAYSTIVGFRLSQIYKAFKVFSRQALVVIANIFERMSREFLECVFSRHPQRMHQFLVLGPDTPIRGKVDINDVLGSTSLPQLVRRLARRAATQASQGKFDLVVANTVQATAGKVDPGVLSTLSEFIEARHKVVHEDDEQEVPPERVYAAFESLMNVTRHFEQAAVSDDVPVDAIDADDDE